MKNKIVSLVIFLLTINIIYSQNKKEQIIALNYSIDSLNKVNSSLKIILDEKSKIISENDIVIKNKEDKITELNNIIENNKKTISEFNRKVSEINMNNSELILINDRQKHTIDSLNTILAAKQIKKYKLSIIEGTGDNCNCGCDAEKQSNGNWRYVGTYACQHPECSGSKIINDYFNSFHILLGQDEFTFQVENNVAIKGRLLNQVIKNRHSVIYKSDTSSYMFKEVNDDDCITYSILFGTLESLTDIQLIHEINNTIRLNFRDGSSFYSLIFTID